MNQLHIILNYDVTKNRPIVGHHTIRIGCGGDSLVYESVMIEIRWYVDRLWWRFGGIQIGYGGDSLERKYNCI